MDLASLDTLIGKRYWEFFFGLPVTWRFPDATPDDPVNAPIQNWWRVWDKDKQPSYRKRQPNFFYADLEFPETYAGHALAGTEARFFINCYCPFTLWVDGEEIFRETHAWHATGPIVDPFPMLIKPGRKHRLVINLEPTEVPASLNALEGVNIRSAACMRTGSEMTAILLEMKIADKLAVTPDEKALGAKAANCVDAGAIEKNDWPRALASLNKAEKILLPFSKRAKAHTVHLIGHTHIDMDWMWTWTDTVHCIRRDAKAVADLMRDFPDVTFSQSQIPTYYVVEEKDPDVFAAMKKHIREGRWECVASTWVEGDLNMADGESVARQMSFAADWLQENVDGKCRVMWAPDTFGHPGNMPQLAKLAEYESYFHWRCNPGRNENWPARVWKGVDGSEILAFSTGYGSWLEPLFMQGNILDYLRAGLTEILHIWGAGDHGGALMRHQFEVLDSYRNRPLIPNFKFNTMHGFAEVTRLSQEKLPSNRGETFSLFEGCFTNQAKIKKFNRHCEGELLAAEALSALARTESRAVLQKAWKGVLFSQFHDIFDGAGVHDSYLDAYQRGEAALNAAAKVSAEAIKSLVTVDKAGSALTVINPLGFPRSEVVWAALPAGTVALQDESGRVIPIQADKGQFAFYAQNVPAFGTARFKLLKKLPGKLSFTQVKVEEAGDYIKIETVSARAQIHKLSGAVCSYFDKRLSRELVAYGVEKTLSHVPCTRKDLAMNVFQILDEAHNKMTAWLVNDILREESLLRGAEVALVESGPVFAKFRVKLPVRSSMIEEEILFYQEMPRVEFRAEIDWQERGDQVKGVPQLKVSMGTGMSAARARFEGPFFITERPADGTDQPTQKWSALCGDEYSLLLLNDSKYGVDALGGRMRLSLLRGAYNPDPLPDIGRHFIRFAFEVHPPRQCNRVFAEAGMSFNRSLRTAMGKSVHPAPVFEILDGVICTGLVYAMHSEGTLIRFFECEGKAGRVSFRWPGIKKVSEVNFLEHVLKGSVKLDGDRVTAKLRPFEVKTLLIL